MAIPLLAGCDIRGRDITADTLLTQRALAQYIVEHGAHYHFTVKGNQPALQAAIALYFEQRGAPAYAETPTLAHGRIACRCNYDEDRSRIRTGHGPANVSRLRHFALGVLKSFQKPGQAIASMLRRLGRRPRIVLDYLRLTANSGATRVGAA